MTRYFVAMALLSFSAGKVWADAPLPAPKTKTVCSDSGLFCVTSDYDARVTSLKNRSTGESLWSVAGWHRWMFVSDDGQTVVIGYKGMNLLPRDVTLDEPVIDIYRNGALVRRILLGEFFKSTSELRPTVSHYAWGSIHGFNRANQLVVALVDGSYAAFAAQTGEREPLVLERAETDTAR